MNAKPFYKDYALKEGPWMTAGKVALYTVGGAAVGTGAGVGFSFIPNPEKLVLVSLSVLLLVQVLV